MRVLFLTDYWFPQMTANSLCVNNIADEIQKSGGEVFVSAYSGEKNEPYEYKGIRFSYVKPSIARRLLQASKHCKNRLHARVLSIMGRFANRFRRAFLLPFYPIVSFSFPLRWEMVVDRMVRENGIDVIVSVVAPDETLLTGYLIKKRNPRVRWNVYYIDAGTNVLKDTSFVALKNAMQDKAKKWENRVLKLASKIIVMEGHAEYYKLSLDSSNLKKLKIANVPLLKISTKWSKYISRSVSSIEKWVYTGSLCGLYYNPKPLCELFLQYRKTHCAELHLYGPSDYREYLETLSSKNSGIIWHGAINHEFIPEILTSADLLVYFMCREIDSVSGKFFEYLGYGKRILYYGNTNDINSKQVLKYERGLSLSMRTSQEKNILSIENFMRKAPANGAVNIASLQDNYRLCLPKTTADIILN